MTVPEASSMGYLKPKAAQPYQSREREMYQAVEIMSCLRAVFVLAQNPTQKLNLKFEHSAGFWALPWMFFRFLR